MDDPIVGCKLCSLCAVQAFRQMSYYVSCVMQVYLGVWQDQEVAVKLARQAPISLKNERQFQANIARLHNLNHPNIVTFLGACCWKASFLLDIMCCSPHNLKGTTILLAMHTDILH